MEIFLNVDFNVVTLIIHLILSLSSALVSLRCSFLLIGINQKSLSYSNINQTDWKYCAVPPELHVLNFENDKFNQNGPPRNLKNTIVRYWRCNQFASGCKATFSTVLSSEDKYPQWALFGFIAENNIYSRSFDNHNHTPQYTLSDAIREWSIQQMMLMMLLNPKLKPKRCIKRFILLHPVEADHFDNIYDCLKRLYNIRLSIHGKLPSTFDQIDYICSESKYSKTFHQRMIEDNNSAGNNHESLSVLHNHHLPYHIEHTTDDTVEMNNKKQIESLALQFSCSVTLSASIQERMNKKRFGSLFLCKTKSNNYIFQSEHAAMRWVRIPRKDVDGSLWKKPDHVYAPDEDHVCRVLPNTMVFCLTKSKVNYEEIADAMIEANLARGIDIRGFRELSKDGELALEVFNKKFAVIDPSLLCLWHHNVTNQKRIKGVGLWKEYLHNADFNWEINIFRANIFLEEDEMKDFRETQKREIYIAFKTDKTQKKHMLKAFFISYQRRYEAVLDDGQYNMFNRSADFTQNSEEALHRRMQEDMGSDKSIYSQLSMWQEQEAWSSYWYDIMVQNDFKDPKNFDRASADSAQRKLALKKYKNAYKSIDKTMRTFEIKRNYLSQVVSIYRDQLKSITDDINKETGDPNMNSKSEKMARVSNYEMLKMKATKKWNTYPPTIAFNTAFTNIEDEKACETFVYEVKESKIWKKIKEKYKIKKQTVPYANRLKNEIAIGSEYERTIIAFRVKSDDKPDWRPGIILMASVDWVSICAPENDGNDKWILQNINDVCVRLL
eukprot:166526_1